ncbi:MAG: beta-galactosidase [Armatimonadetes bacterium]|nr:beta-galactosidase [Armatimonadota bacterium]
MIRSLLVCLLAIGGYCIGLADVDIGPWVFIYGVHDPAAIDRLPALGCNVAYIAPEVVDTIGLGAGADLIDRAGAAGLKSIVAIPTVLNVPGRLPSAGGEAYREWVTGVIRTVVERFGDNPNVIAWATGDLLEEAIDYNESDFRAFLQRRYSSIQALNTAWEASFGDFGQASQNEARKIDETMPLGVGRASLDVADYRLKAFHDVMQHWARTIKALDPNRPLLTGRLSRYRSCLAVPDEYDIICPWASPDTLESDLLAHNMHAVAIARRAGKFAVIPCLDVPLDEVASKRGDLQRWIGLAGIHGARGIGLADWSRLQLSPAPAVVEADVQRCAAAALTGDTLRISPISGFAMLYQPYAGGLSTATGPAYGFIDGPAEGEPGSPFADFRLGCRFGFPEYLTLDDLTATNVSRYSAIVAPVALGLPEPVSRQLSDYVREGGALITDLGAGMRQTGSWLHLPELLSSTFGIRRLVQMRHETGANLRVSWAPPWLPSMLRGTQTRGTFRDLSVGSPRASVSSGVDKRRETSGPASQSKSWHVSGPVCFADLDQSAGAVAVLTTAAEEGRRVIAGIIGNQCGDGVALFATHQLWANWQSSDPVYAALHHDLLASRPLVEIVQAPFWTAGLCATATQDGVAVFNGTTETASADVIAHAASDALHRNCVCTFSAFARTPQGLRSGAVQLSVDVPALRTVHCPRTPITLEPYRGTCAAKLLEYSRQRVRFEFGGTGAPIAPGPDGVLGVGEGEDTVVRLRLRDGDYAVNVGSFHTITLDHGRGRVERLQVESGLNRALEVTLNARKALVTVEPARR